MSRRSGSPAVTNVTSRARPYSVGFEAAIDAAFFGHPMKALATGSGQRF